MSDQLASWIGDIIDAACLLLTIVRFSRRKSPCRRQRQVRKFRQWKIGSVKYTRSDEIDDRRF
jgi:hypothetical protein